MRSTDLHTDSFPQLILPSTHSTETAFLEPVTKSNDHFAALATDTNNFPLSQCPPSWSPYQHVLLVFYDLYSSSLSVSFACSSSTWTLYAGILHVLVWGLLLSPILLDNLIYIHDLKLSDIYILKTPKSTFLTEISLGPIAYLTYPYEKYISTFNLANSKH